MLTTNRGIATSPAKAVMICLLLVAAFISDNSSVTAEETQPVRLRVLSYNIHHGRGSDNRIDLQRIAKVINDSRADLVALQEVDVKTSRSAGIDQLAELEKLTGLKGKFGKGRDYQGGDYGQAILSRFPIKSSEVVSLPGIVPGEADLRVALITTVDSPKGELLFATTHLHHEKEEHRMAQATRLLEHLDMQDTTTLILAGDFNAEPGKGVMIMLTERLQDCTTTNSLTYPADKPIKKIDWVFMPKSGRLKLATGTVINEPEASDHRPVLVELELN